MCGTVTSQEIARYPEVNVRTEQKQQYAQNKLVKRLQRQVGQAIGDFNMIGEGDRVAPFPAAG